MVFGVCAAIEEEKDPRCLLLVFLIVESLTLVFPDSDGPVADCAEDLFDIVSRYFPISFNPVSCSKNFATHKYPCSSSSSAATKSFSLFHLEVLWV